MDDRSEAVGGARGVGHHVVVGLVVLGVVHTANLRARGDFPQQGCVYPKWSTHSVIPHRIILTGLKGAPERKLISRSPLSMDALLWPRPKKGLLLNPGKDGGQ